MAYPREFKELSMRISPASLLFITALLTGGHACADDAKFKIGEQLPQAAPDPKSAYQEVKWSALIPEGWNPAKSLKGLKFDKLSDADPSAMEALEKMKEAWNAAPVEPAWNGSRIRITGFAVPLERSRERVTEFLLVPYFGACIHTPPPPANQIIHVFVAKPGKKMQTFDALQVSGTLETAHSQAENEMGIGNSAYRMKADTVEPYKKR
jgi:uncharacterized protein